MDYFKLFQTSLRQFKKNPIIVLPDLFFYIFAYLMAMFFYKASGLDELVKKTILVNAVTMDYFSSFVASNWFQLLVSVFAFVVGTFMIGIGVDVVRFRLLKRLTERKKLNLFKQIFGRNPYFLKVFLMKIYVYIISIFIVMVVTAVVVVLY